MFQKDSSQKERTNLKLTCPACRKPFKSSRQGSLTGWIFGTMRCNCTSSISREKPAIGKQPLSESSIPDLDLNELDELQERFHFDSSLGEGGMGEVFSVYDVNSGSKYALKVLREELGDSEAARRRFEREGEVLSALTHPNIAAVFEHGITSGNRPYQVMELVEGLSLEDFIANRANFDASFTLGIFRQIAAAVEYAHAHGIVHRDIKPSNVVLKQLGDNVFEIKVLDFGIAKILPSQGLASTAITQSGEIFGSPLYMSPEQCLGAEQSESSDIYSLGVVLYEALTGINPFDAENPVKVILNQINKNPEPVAKNTSGLGNLSAQNLNTILDTCLQKDPEQRYKSVTALLKDLDLLLDGKPIKTSRRMSTGNKSLLRKAIVAAFVTVTISLLCFTFRSFIFPVDQTGVLEKELVKLEDKVRTLKDTRDGESLNKALLQQVEDRIRLARLYEIESSGLAEKGDSHMASAMQMKARDLYKQSMVYFETFGEFQEPLFSEALNSYFNLLLKQNDLTEALRIYDFACKFGISVIPDVAPPPSTESEELNSRSLLFEESMHDFSFAEAIKQLLPEINQLRKVASVPDSSNKAFYKGISRSILVSRLSNLANCLANLGGRLQHYSEDKARTFYLQAYSAIKEASGYARSSQEQALLANLNILKEHIISRFDISEQQPVLKQVTEVDLSDPLIDRDKNERTSKGSKTSAQVTAARKHYHLANKLEGRNRFAEADSQRQKIEPLLLADQARRRKLFALLESRKNALELLRDGDFTNAEKVLTSLVRKSKNDIELRSQTINLLSDLAVTQQKQEKTEGAIRTLTEALELADKDPMSYQMETSVKLKIGSSSSHGTGLGQTVGVSELSDRLTSLRQNIGIENDSPRDGSSAEIETLRPKSAIGFSAFHYAAETPETYAAKQIESALHQEELLMTSKHYVQTSEKGPVRCIHFDGTVTTE